LSQTQTRIDSRAQQLAHAAHIGNVYINRNQIQTT
jgi:RHH-type proline utilization regulon transcriptional repressor/proline dehydrogenase/delta 1-pyrroline-5-carboxylate dehydrogenase